VCHERIISILKRYKQGATLIKINWDRLSFKDEDWSFEFTNNKYEGNEGQENRRYLNVNMDFLYSHEFKG